MKLKVDFKEAEENFMVSFGKVLVIERTEIPPEYGLITYDQNRTITVS